MTYPTAKTSPHEWLAADATARDAIGSREGLRAGNFCVQQDDGARYKCSTVDGLDASTWAGSLLPDDVTINGDLTMDSPSPHLVAGDGTDSPDITLNKSDSGWAGYWLQYGTTFWEIGMRAAEDLLFVRWVGDVEQDITAVAIADHAWIMPGELEIDGDLNHDGSNLGVLGTGPVAKPNVVGAKAGNVALTNLMVALDSQGIVTDGTS